MLQFASGHCQLRGFQQYLHSAGTNGSSGPGERAAAMALHRARPSRGMVGRNRSAAPGSLQTLSRDECLGGEGSGAEGEEGEKKGKKGKGKKERVARRREEKLEGESSQKERVKGVEGPSGDAMLRGAILACLC